VKKYRHQFAKDPNIDVTKVRAASLTSDAEAAIICPVRHTLTCMHACMHILTDIGRLARTHRHGEAHLLECVRMLQMKCKTCKHLLQVFIWCV